MPTRKAVVAAWLLSAAALSAPGRHALAQEATVSDPSHLTLSTQRVMVFKDGTCLVVKRATGTAAEDGLLSTTEVPDAAVLGTFWALPDQEGALLGMSAGVETEEVDREVESACTSVLDVLLENKGRSAAVEMHDGTVHRGTILEVLTHEAPAAPPSPDLSHLLATQPTGRRVEDRPASASLFVLRAGDQDLLLQIGAVRQLSLPEMKLTTTRRVHETQTRKRLTLRMRGAGRHELTLLYFRPGVRWIPTYRLTLPGEGEERARIALMAEILNEAEDLENVPFDLVVGVPNFRFRDTVSPLVLERTLLNALAHAAPSLMGQALSNVSIRSRAGEWAGREPSPAATAPELPEELTAGGRGDLYVYHLAPMTLLRGHRAAVPIFTTDAPMEEVHTLDLDLSQAATRTAQTAAAQTPSLELLRNQVWHEVELSNPSPDMPWTTGPVMVLSGWQPIAQELLTYTPAGARVRVPLTVAVGVRATHEIEEVERVENATTWAGYRYARIDYRGTVRVTNHTSEAVDLEIRCRTPGRATSAGEGAQVQVLDRLDTVNSRSVVTFPVRLAPRETVERDVAFQVFTRH